MHRSSCRNARVALTAALLAIALVAVACGGGSSNSSSTSTSSPARTDPPGTWTVLVYMAADNNLEASALRDIAQMKQTTGTDFVVLLDRAPGYSTAPALGIGDFTDAAIAHIRDGRVEPLKGLGEVDTGDPRTLSSFISFGLTKYPNPKHALVIWDHGGGWRGTSWDESSNNDNLSLAETATALHDGLAATDVAEFDLIGFDACLMATYEVAAAMAPYGEVMVASEELEPGNGWNWTSLTTPAGGLTITQMSDAILKGYLDESTAAGESLVTMSTIDLAQLAPLAAASDALSAAMTDQVRDAIGRVGYARSRAVSFGRSPEPTEDYWSVDLGSLSTELEHVDGLAAIAAQLHDAVHAAVLRRVDGGPVARASGIAAYFPPASTLYATTYDRADFAPSWTSVLRSYYRTAAAVPSSQMPEFVLSNQLLPSYSVVSDAASIELLAKVRAGTGGNITDAIIQWGLVDAAYGTVNWFGEMSAGVAGDTVSGAYTWDQMILSDGVRSVMAYASLQRDAHGALQSIIIPIAFVRGDQSANGSIQLTFTNDAVTSQTIFVTSDSAISAIEPEPGDVVVPLLLKEETSGASKWIASPGGGVLADAASLHLDYGALPPATSLMLRLVITDVAGGTDVVRYRTLSP